MLNMYHQIISYLSRFKFKASSFSQSGEDLIVRFIFNSIGIKRPSYIDIGAHHPNYLNNTAIFYLEGSHGINIEPDPNLFSKFRQYRRRDINLNLGISEKKSVTDFYIISCNALNTFSKQEAESYVKDGNYTIKSVIKIETQTIAWVIEKYCNGDFPHLLSIDAEGYDELIIKQIDFEKSFPIVICIETIAFSHTGIAKKNTDLINYIISKGYIIYADTYINTIFVRKEKWENR